MVSKELTWLRVCGQQRVNPVECVVSKELTQLSVDLPFLFLASYGCGFLYIAGGVYVKAWPVSIN